jgi:hypothetical protein
MRDVPAETLDVVGFLLGCFMRCYPDCQKTRHVGQLRRLCLRVFRSGDSRRAPRLLLPASVTGNGINASQFCEQNQIDSLSNGRLGQRC